jgi:hypothetical protein
LKKAKLQENSNKLDDTSLYNKSCCTGNSMVTFFVGILNISKNQQIHFKKTFLAKSEVENIFSFGIWTKIKVLTSNYSTYSPLKLKVNSASK